MCVYVYMSVFPCVWEYNICVCEGQKRALNPLELKLQACFGCLAWYVGVEMHPVVLMIAQQALAAAPQLHRSPVDNHRLLAYPQIAVITFFQF